MKRYQATRIRCQCNVCAVDRLAKRIMFIVLALVVIVGAIRW